MEFERDGSTRLAIPSCAGSERALDGRRPAHPSRAEHCVRPPVPATTHRRLLRSVAPPARRFLDGAWPASVTRGGLARCAAIATCQLTWRCSRQARGATEASWLSGWKTLRPAYW